MTKTRLIASLAALVAASAVAGPAIEDPACSIPFTGELSVGYETNYIFRGVNLGEDAPWASIGLNLPLNEKLSLDVGTWYINSTNNPDNFDELDTYAFLNFSVLGLDASFGGTWYQFPEPGGNTGELSLGLSKDLKIFELGGFTAFDMGDVGGWYFETRALRTLALTDCLDLNLGSGISFTQDYSFRTPYLGADGWNHAYVRLGLGWHMTESATLNTYIGGNFALNALETIDDANRLHGGASVSVAF